ncbi:MAG: hypothetical protein ACI8U3_000280 [Brevundimonas sp.]|jgi:hypothetical protein|uniref:hypothetical protein n=1 Tax=Brevundimonas sp. TaxID=1871086 RepID=UPI0039E25223
MARTIALDALITVSNRLQPLIAAVLCVMAMQLIAAACTPEPAAPYAVRAAVER